MPGHDCEHTARPLTAWERLGAPADGQERTCPPFEAVDVGRSSSRRFPGLRPVLSGGFHTGSTPPRACRPPLFSWVYRVINVTVLARKQPLEAGDSRART